MVNRKYNRTFVLMTGKNAGQSLNGSCDMEVINGKGRLYAYVGKLNKLTYKPKQLYLISVGLMGTLAVSAGQLQSKGKNASIEVEFDPNNLFGSGMTFEEISAIAVWGEDDGPNNAVLEGFVSKRLNWHSNLEIFGDVQQQKQERAERIFAAANSNDKKDYKMENTKKLYRSSMVGQTKIGHTNINELVQVNNTNELSTPGGIRVPGGTTAPGEISIPGEGDVPMGTRGVDATEGIEVPSGVDVPGVNVPNGSSIPNMMSTPRIITPGTTTPRTTPGTTIPRTTTPGTTTPGTTTPGVTTPGTTTPGTTTPGTTTPGTTIPRTTTPGTTPGTTIPRTVTPGTTTPGTTMPGTMTPGTTPGTTIPRTTTPGTTPGTMTPGTTTPGTTTPGVTTPGTTMPGTTTPRTTTPGVTTPGTTTPGTTPGTTIPRTTTPGTTTPGTTPGTTIPRTTTPGTTPGTMTPGTTTPGTTTPGTTTPGVIAPGTTTPGTTIPRTTTPGTTTPGTTPGTTTPGTTPRTTTPGVTTPGTTTPGTTTPGTTTPGTTTPGTTTPGTTTQRTMTPGVLIPDGINELGNENGFENLNELEEIEDTATDLNEMEAVQNQFKDDISGLAAKLAENISKADKMNGMSASETLANMSPHDTFRAISQRFRKELNMLDEMGIIDKKKFFGEEESGESEKDVLKAVEPQSEIPETLEQNNKNKKDSGFTIGEMTLTDRLFSINDKLNTEDGREWIKLDYREAYFIDNAIKEIRSLYVKNAARKARHMIIGRDGRNMFIGIPGKVSDRGRAEQNGFYDFLAVNSTSESGYWIKAI